MGFADRAKQNAAKGVAQPLVATRLPAPVAEPIRQVEPAAKVVQPARQPIAPQPAETSSPSSFDSTPVSDPARAEPVAWSTPVGPIRPATVDAPKPVAEPTRSEPLQPVREPARAEPPRVIRPAQVPVVRQPTRVEPTVPATGLAEPTRTAVPCVRADPPRVVQPAPTVVQPQTTAPPTQVVADQTSVLPRAGPITQVVNVQLANEHTLEIGARLHLNDTIILEYDHEATKGTATVYLVKKGTTKYKAVELIKNRPVQTNFAGYRVSLELIGTSEIKYEQYNISVGVTTVPIPKTDWAIGKKLKAIFASPFTYGIAAAGTTAYFVYNWAGSIATDLNIKLNGSQDWLTAVAIIGIPSVVVGVVAGSVVAGLKFVGSKLFGPKQPTAQKVMKPKGPSFGQRFANSAKSVGRFSPEMIHTAAAGYLVYLLYNHPSVTQILGQYQDYQESIASWTAAVFGVTILSSIIARARGKYVPKTQTKKPVTSSSQPTLSNPQGGARP